jgi:hypothetical protein
MKHIAAAVWLVLMVGCSTPNPHPTATTTAYEQVKAGMTRAQVYALLGPPKWVQPAGDIEHCEKARWGIPHDQHGWGRWTVTFDGDKVSGVSTSHAMASTAFDH